MWPGLPTLCPVAKCCQMLPNVAKCCQTLVSFYDGSAVNIGKWHQLHAVIVCRCQRQLGAFGDFAGQSLLDKALKNGLYMYIYVNNVNIVNMLACSHQCGAILQSVPD